MCWTTVSPARLSSRNLLLICQLDQTSVQKTVDDLAFDSEPTSDHMRASNSGSSLSSRRKRARRESVIRRSTELDPENFILPPFVLAQELVEYFFVYTYPVYPVLHEPTFRKEFKATYQDSSRPTAALLSILNLVFAFGCDYLDMSLHDASELAQTFHERGAELVLSVCFDQSTVQIVQALFLLTAHLQSNLKMNKSWVSIGCLVRTAQGLRINMDPSGWESSLVDQEIRKRLWWGIYCLDR